MKISISKIWFFVLVIAIISLFFLIKNHSFLNSYIFGETQYSKIENTSKESCLQCHQNTKGYSKYHDPELIGCASCHLGNTQSDDKDESHKGMILIPGNLSNAKETCGKCHPNELKKIENSLMTTNSGIVAVDKFIFGEAETPNDQYHIRDLKYSPADKHLRDLCANCHLGAEKTNFGEINQLSRGGGCNACHLNYNKESKNDLELYLSSNKVKLPTTHPSTDIFVKNEHCFGCHSRSSRISTNYEGWQETLLDESDLTNFENYRVLEDKRVYKYIEEDLHHAKGLLCIDCHSSHEVMGDGKIYSHEEQAVKIKCSDCHFKNKPNTIPYDSLDTESLLVFLHRDYDHSDKEIISVNKGGHPLVNTYVDSLGNAFLIGKKDGKLHDLKPQSELCSRDMAHKNLDCSTCHASWTPRCIGCHNVYDKNETNAYDLLDKKMVKGQWKEFVAEFSSSLPAMGVRESGKEKRIEPAIPGMILTIDKGSFTNKKINKDVSFHRLYAPNSPHTTVKKVRDCKSCHTNPASIGYGNGTLTYDTSSGYGKWKFIPEYELNKNDGLPEDAWIPFLEKKQAEILSTRTDFRPFNLEEQKNILLIGACLQCHKEDSSIMKQSLIGGLKPLLLNISKECILPIE